MSWKVTLPMLGALAFAISVIAADGEEGKPAAKAAGETKTVVKEAADAAPAEKAELKSEQKAARPVAIPGNASDWDACLANSTVLEDLKKRTQELDAKEKELKAKESDLKARDAAISDELKKLEALRKDVAGLKASRRQKNEEQVAKLIETIEKMSPKAAAPLLAKVDEDLAVAAMNGLSTEKLAKIMGTMDLQRSIRLSELLAMGENAPVREPSGKETASGPASRP